MAESGIDYRIVAGRVSAEGNRISGTEFDCSREDNGKYHITFRPSFDIVWGCSVAQIGFDDGHNDPRDNALPYAIGEGSIHVVTGDSSGNRRDRPFTFVVVGV